MAGKKGKRGQKGEAGAVGAPGLDAPCPTGLTSTSFGLGVGYIALLSRVGIRASHMQLFGHVEGGNNYVLAARQFANGCISQQVQMASQSLPVAGEREIK